MLISPGSGSVITLQFSATGGLESDAIKLFSRGWPSHVDAMFPGAGGTLLGARSDVIGGQPPGVRIRPLGYETWQHTQVIQLNATPEQEDAFHRFLFAQVGKPYDKIAIAAFAVARDWREPDSWFCSELIAAALEACDWFPAPLANVVNEITPRDLLLLVSPWAVAAPGGALTTTTADGALTG